MLLRCFKYIHEILGVGNFEKSRRGNSDKNYYFILINKFVIRCMLNVKIWSFHWGKGLLRFGITSQNF